MGCKRCPYWCDRQPVISTPAEKIVGSFWGRSKVACVEQAQYWANDAINMALDSAQYALAPIVMTDPLKNPRIGSMVMDMAAIWSTNPNDTQIVTFPPVWKDALELVSAARSQINDSLSVNPAMMHSSSGKKPSQAETAQQAQVAIESTADPVSILETCIFTPMVQRFALYDHQFRDDALLVEIYGEQGIKATMEEIPPIQWNDRYVFKWYGQDATKTQQQTQQMIAGLNVLRGLPPQAFNGKRLDVTPIIEEIVNNVYGPHITPRVIIDDRNDLSVAPEMENELMHNGLPCPVHPADDDKHHIDTHMAMAQKSGDENGLIRAHVAEHMRQMAGKSAPKGAPQQPTGQQGAPGGAGPGAAGTPKPGAQPSMPRGGQAPPGTIPQDEMHDASRVPRLNRR